MSKNRNKPITPMSINEVLCLSRIAKGLGFSTQSIPSHTSATFMGVRIYGVNNPMNEKKFISSTFANHYGGRKLNFSSSGNTTNKLYSEVMVSVLA